MRIAVCNNSTNLFLFYSLSFSSHIKTGFCSYFNPSFFSIKFIFFDFLPLDFLRIKSFSSDGNFLYAIQSARRGATHLVE